MTVTLGTIPNPPSTRLTSDCHMTVVLTFTFITGATGRCRGSICAAFATVPAASGSRDGHSTVFIRGKSEFLQNSHSSYTADERFWKDQYFFLPAGENWVKNMLGEGWKMKDSD